MKLIVPFILFFVISCSSVDDEFKAPDCQKRVVYQLKDNCDFKVGQQVYYVNNVIGEISDVSCNEFTLCLKDTLIVRNVIDVRVLEVEISEKEFIKIFPLKGLMDVQNQEVVKAFANSQHKSLSDSVLQSELKNKMENLLNESEEVIRSMDSIKFDRKALDAGFNKLSETLDSLKSK